MRDWAGGTEGRNYMVTRHMDIRNLNEMLATLLCILMVAGVLGFHLWIRVRMVDMGYETQELLNRQNTATRLRNQLIVEEEFLKRPARIEKIAFQQLGMTPVRFEQIIPVKIQGVETDGSTALALAGPRDLRAAPGKTANDN